jgi:hypothetical protein
MIRIEDRLGVPATARDVQAGVAAGKRSGGNDILSGRR